MEIGSNPPGPGAAAATGARNAAETRPSASEQDGAGLAGAEADFETFLTLLTTQMRNQDPLKPMESTEFVAQLADFSSVEQQIRTNERLDSILEAISGEAGAAYLGWIGKQVQAPALAEFNGRPLEIAVSPQPGAERAMLVVENAAGEEVARQQVPPAAETLTWAGQMSGGTAPEGQYGFRVEYLDGSGPLGTEPGRVYVEVSELRLEQAGPRLILEGGQKIDPETVAAVRAD